jgi:hypothetical protein
MLIAILLGLTFTGGVAGAATPTATHAQPEPVKVGEAISLNVTIDTHNTIIYSADVWWWTSLSDVRYLAGLATSAGAATQVQSWTGEIPAQGRACQVYYYINITYEYNNPGLPYNSQASIYLPGTQGNYLVTVKGDIFATSSLISIAIGIGLMVLAVGVIIYAQRATPKWDPRYEETVKKAKEKVELDENGNIKGEDAKENAFPEGNNSAPPESCGPEGKPNAGKTAKKVKLESNGSPPSS